MHISSIPYLEPPTSSLPLCSPSSVTTATDFPRPQASKPWPGPAPSPRRVVSERSSSSAAAAIESSVALSSSSPDFQCANQAGLWPTGATSALAVALTLMPTAGWPIAGWPSSGRCGRTARPTTRPITCSNALYVVDQDPDTSVVFVDSF